MYRKSFCTIHGIGVSIDVGGMVGRMFKVLYMMDKALTGELSYMQTCRTDFQIKSLLSVDSYKVFSKALMEYKKHEDLLKVVAVLADLFTEDKRNYHLFASKFDSTATV